MKIKQVKMGYCNSCCRPQVVGLLALPGWHHEYAICESCLRQLALEVQQGGQQVLKGLGHS
jgi:hypothetical protein